MLPRRAIVAVATTAIALVLLFSFKTPDSGIASSATGSTVAVARPTAASPATRSSSSAGAVTGGGSSAATGQAATGTFTGAVISTRFGNVQVQVTLRSGKIVDVQALELPSGDRHTNEISSVVGPTLQSEVLQAQSAQIDLVSGATYTSDAYARSLQSALDQALG
jgi:uncharacterized protein with FMN-binding domain